MSYDVWIGDASFNYTSNVSRLFYDHIPEQRNRGGLHELDGLTGAQASRLLSDAFSAIHGTYLRVWTEGEVGAATFCQAYDANNGWGSTVGALIFLAQILAACATNPRKRVRVSA